MNSRAPIQPADPAPQSLIESYLPEGQLAYPQPEPKQQLIDVASIRGMLFRQRWLIAAVVTIAAILGLVGTLMTTPQYAATATVQVKPNDNYVVDGQDVDPGIFSNQIYDFMNTQAAVIQSRNLAEVVAQEANLGERYDILGADVDEGRPPNVSDEEWQASKEQMAAGMISGSVSSVVPKDNWIMEIRYISENPVFAAEMANAYADAFVATDTRSTVDTNEYAQEYLQQEIVRVRENLKEAEAIANNYARNNGIITTGSSAEDGGSGATLQSTNLQSVNLRLSEARAARIQAEQRWRATQDLPAAQLPEVQQNPVLMGLVTERSRKAAELVQLRQRYNDQFPQIQSVLAQIEALDAQINEASAEIKSTVRNDYQVALRQEQAFERELNSATGSTLAEQDLLVQYGVFEREANAIRAQLNTLLSRYNTVSSAANVQSSQLAKLDNATVPAIPFSPNLMRNMTIALVLGIAGAVGLAIVIEVLDTRIRSLQEVEEKVGLPLLGYTPYIDERNLDQSQDDQLSILMESYASIRSTIEFSLHRNENVIQLTSTQASEGKTTTAVILAEIFARLGRRTLLIDFDLRRPSVAKLMDINRPKVGLVEVLLGHAELESAIVTGKHEHLEILPVGDTPPNPTDIMASEQLRNLIEEQRKNYSLIIIDSPPVMGLADAPMLASNVDATVLILEANRVTFAQAKSAISRIERAGGRPLGIVLTKYRALEAGENYDYQYNYYSYSS